MKFVLSKKVRSALIVIIFLILGIMYINLASEYASYKVQSEEQAQHFNNEITQLNQKNQELEASSNNLQTEINKIQNEISKSITDIENYKAEIQSSMDWFKTNSVLNENTDDGKTVIKNLESSCFKKDFDKCYIKTGCLCLTNSEMLNIHYKPDIETTGKVDKLQSIAGFINNRGGDCEDYALFYKAEFNSLLKACGVHNTSNIFLESWFEIIGSPNETCWLDFGKTWYMPSESSLNLKQSYVYPNVVCGSIYDLNLGNISGHCVIAFTKQKITYTSDLIQLNGAPLVEPQTGAYMGLINDMSSEIYLASFNPYAKSTIDEVITDNDLFLFSNDEWLSYSMFYNILDNQELQLHNLAQSNISR